VYERAGGHAYGSVYPGPIGAVLTPQLTGVRANPSLPFASTLCGACFDACPVRIDIPSLLVHLRAQVVAASSPMKPERVAMRALGWVMAAPGRFRAAIRSARLARPVLRRRRFLPGPAGRWTASRDAPVPPAETFREWWRRTRHE
jgi:L-lactate dehydrogenase complex protein LldF